MDLETVRERLDRRQETLLQTDHEQPRGRLRAPRRSGKTLLPHGTVLVKEARQQKLGRVAWESIDHEGDHVALREAALDLASGFGPTCTRAAMKILWRHSCRYPGKPPASSINRNPAR